MTSKLTCYQCERETTWLAPDSRCGRCTRYTPEQIKGEAPVKDEENYDD